MLRPIASINIALLRRGGRKWPNSRLSYRGRNVTTLIARFHNQIALGGEKLLYFIVGYLFQYSQCFSQIGSGELPDLIKVDCGGHAGQRRRAGKQRSERYRNIEFAPHSGCDLSGQERMTSQIEEIIGSSDLFDSKHLRPDASETSLG